MNLTWPVEGGPWARSVPLCRCGQPARSQEVKKDGLNKGRSFFTCSKSRLGRLTQVYTNSIKNQFRGKRDEKCDFFQFVDDVASSERSTKSFAPSVVVAAAEPPPCQCGEAAAVQVTQKEGTNKGRAFYCCRKPRFIKVFF